MLEHSVKFSKEIIDRLFSSGNILTRRIAKAFVKKGISLVEKYLDEIRKNPEILMDSLKNVKLNSMKELMEYIL